jgi:hypothetical protein
MVIEDSDANPQPRDRRSSGAMVTQGSMGLPRDLKEARKIPVRKPKMGLFRLDRCVLATVRAAVAIRRKTHHAFGEDSPATVKSCERRTRSRCAV